MLLLLALSAGGALLFLYLWGRIYDRRWRDWERLLPPEGWLPRTLPGGNTAIWKTLALWLALLSVIFLAWRFAQIPPS